MCGIAGMVLRGSAPVDLASLREMTGRIAHRGPDGDGFHTAPGVGLGHRRLSILDLSEHAAQPMLARGGELALTFNGEIYNFADVRAELARDGASFTSSGDTEVLLRALERWGKGALARVHGMFAFGFWSERDRSLLLARDRFGKKPVYYAPFGENGVEGVAFASEMRALLAHPRVRAERALDPTALVQYLVHDCVPAPRSILANVRKLLPGECLTWRDDGRGISLESYYTPRYGRWTRGDPDELAAELTRLVAVATADRLVADVPVGIFLSGGLDSSFIAACAVRVHPRVKTFAIGFDDPSFDESGHARTVAAHLGTEHVEERLSPGAMLEIVPGTLDWIDEPFADGSLIPTTLLARLAARDVKVALSGDGGDELLAGYPTFVADKAAGWMPAWPGAMARAARRAVALVPPSDANLSLGFKLKHFAHGLDARGARRHAQWMAPLAPEDIVRLARVASPDELGRAFEAVDRASAGAPSAFDAAIAYYLRIYLGEDVLMKVDRATMRHSLESRAPLLDTRVVEFCLGLDPSVRLRGRTTKWIMRKAIAPLVPRSIVERPKKGFGAPIGAWLRGPLAPMVRETLSPARLRESGWLDPATATAMVDAHLSGRADLRKPLWSMLVLEHWRRRWFA